MALNFISERSRTFLAIILFACAAPISAQVESNLPGAGFDQPQPAPPQPTTSSAPILHVNARETIVNVTVTDSQGQPVYYLTRNDFTVSEDGHPQPIRSFGEFGRTEPSVRHLPSLPSNVYTNYHASPTTGPVNILLIDSLNVSPDLVVHAQQSLIDYIHEMPAGTQVAIFSLSATGLQVLQGFTSDSSLLLRAMDANFLSLATNTESTRRDLATLDALDKIATYVAGIKGRKNLIWFTSTMPITFTRDGGYSWGEADMAKVHRTMDIFEHFASEQIAVCPVDSGGVTKMATGDGRLFRIGFDPRQRMEAVAEDTGGIAYFENNDLKSQIAQAINDGAHFYTLSYVPPRTLDDGHYHHIDITISRPGLHLVYRRGYNAEDPKPVTPPIGQALLTASLEGQAPASTQLLFDVRILPVDKAAAPATPASGRHVLKNPDKAVVPYTFLFVLPSGQIAFTDGPGQTHTGAVEFDVAAFDIHGRLIGSAGQTMHLPLTQAEFSEFNQEPFQLAQQIDLPPGQIYLRLGVLDTISQKVGTLETSIAVAKPAPGAP